MIIKGSDYNLVLDDEKVKELASVTQQYCYIMEENVASYLRILKGIYLRSISSGETCEAIKAFHACATDLKGCFEGVGNSFELTVNFFLDDVDDADKYLY